MYSICEQLVSFLPSESSLTRHHSAVGIVVMHVSISHTLSKEKREGEEISYYKNWATGSQSWLHLPAGQTSWGLWPTYYIAALSLAWYGRQLTLLKNTIRFISRTYALHCIRLLQDLRALETFIVSVLTALNPDISQDTYQEAAEDIAAFETSLAEVCVWWRGEGVEKQ